MEQKKIHVKCTSAQMLDPITPNPNQGLPGERANKDAELIKN